ncbi:hypothetical protein BH11ARM2_BH11ARM2_38510 [soil metagenome]
MALVKRIVNALGTGALAAVGTTATVTALGKRETGSSAAAINATSHIVWGDEAAEQDEVSKKYTLTGAVLNVMAVVGWAAVQEAALGRWVRKGSTARALASGTAISALAYATDYYVVPKRFTPGFEKRISQESLVAMYAVLAICLAVGASRSDTP